MNTRKGTLLALTALVIAIVLGAPGSSSAAPLPGGTLDPLTIPKYVTPLVIPPEMPPTVSQSDGTKYYEIAVRQFLQQVLPPPFPQTTVWSYGSVQHPGTAAEGGSFHYPAFTIEANADKTVQVKWINDLRNPADNTFLPHLLPVDQTLMWANPPGPIDSKPAFTNGTPGPYTGPVPVIVHLHGAHVDPISDGYPKSWYLPDASNIDCIDALGYPKTPDPADDFYCKGSRYDSVAPTEAGAALFAYRNDQRATTLWFHDHSLGMTRSNVYAGPAGFYLIRGGTSDRPVDPATPGGLPGPAPKVGDAPNSRYFEIPIVIQDRSFNTDGSLFYPDSRSFFDGFLGPYIGNATPSDVAPLHNPEFFGNTMVVNGKTWPFLEVEPRKYRFRFLNGSDSRFLILKFELPEGKLPFIQIGTEGGFLPAPVALNQLLLGLAERADVVVDFSVFKPGSVITLLNVGPDSPFGGLPFPRSLLADPATTGQVMQFRVVAGPKGARDTSKVGRLPALTPIAVTPATPSRKVSLNEDESALVCVDKTNTAVPCGTKGAVPMAPISARLGTVDPLTGLGVPLFFDDAVTENPALNGTEIWEIHNFTVDAHPIHVHQVMFQVVDRTPMGSVIGGNMTRPPEAWETGFKDTVIAYPGEVTRIKAKFDIEGLFLWHCHILSHEDNEMMRPFCVGTTGCNP